ncbi:hypothetical protein QYM36_014433 [Artemia franciscana]|uniref:Uncharacterized protein n=1 Tax=Artemia franciscana TaxID=6661 RepID=A0AA88HNB3_ARTSF|nr:hypothetical protein QYM36_014433 [Artemia franciscana]
MKPNYLSLWVAVTTDSDIEYSFLYMSDRLESQESAEVPSSTSSDEAEEGLSNLSTDQPLTTDMASKAVTPEVVRPLPKAGKRSEKPKGRKRLCSKILTNTPEKERLEAERQIKEAKKSKKKSRAGRKGTAKRNITADLDEGKESCLAIQEVT